MRMPQSFQGPRQLYGIGILPVDYTFFHHRANEGSGAGRKRNSRAEEAVFQSRRACCQARLELNSTAGAPKVVVVVGVNLVLMSCLLLLSA